MPTGTEIPWLLQAIATLVAEQGVERLRWTWRWKLARRSAQYVENPPRTRLIRQFLRRSETLALLSSGTPEAADQLRRGLIETLKARDTKTHSEDGVELREAMADRLIPVLLKQFLRVLDPTSAIVVANEREMQELRIIRSSQEAIEKGVLVTDGLLPELIGQLPPNARSHAERLADNDRAAAIVLLEALVLDERGAARAATGLIEDPPQWLMDQNYRAWLCLGEVALGHSKGRAAATSFEKAVAGGAPNAPRWFARAALAVLGSDDTALTRDLADKSLAAGGDLLLGLVEAVLSGDEDQIMATAASVVDSNHADSDLVKGVSATIEAARKQWDECIAICRQRIDSNPEITTARLVLARALLARMHEGRTTRAIQDWREALEQLRMCRDLRRRWHGPSHEALALACAAAILVHDPGLCLRIGRAAPAGEATEEEALHQEVLEPVIAAAIESGRLDVATELIGKLNDEFPSLHLKGLLAETQGDKDKALVMYRQAVDLAVGLEQLSAALMALATLDVPPLPRLEELRSLSAEHADLAEAMSELTTGNFEEAMRLLRPYTTRSGMKLLAMIQSDAGQEDDAILTLHSLFDRFQDGDALVSAAELFFGRDDLVGAEAEIDRALALVPLGTPQRFQLQRLRIAVAERRNRWHDVVTYAQACLNEEADPDPEITWALLVGLNNLGRVSAAAEVVAKTDLVPKTDQDAQLLIVLLREQAPTEAVVERLVRIGWDFEEVELVAASALMVAYETSHSIDLEAGLVSRLHQLTEAFLDRFPHSEHFRRIKFDSIEELLPQLREQLQGGQAAFIAAVESVSEQGHPQGILAAVTGRTYTEILLKRAAGWTPAVRHDESVRLQEAKVAEASIGREVVLDASVLATFSLIEEGWRDIQAAFSGLIFLPATILDIQTGRVILGQRSTTSLGWDPQGDRPVMLEIDETDADDLATRAEWMATTAETLRVPDEGNLASLTIPADDRSSQRLWPWIGPIRFAKSRGLPLMTDDVGHQWLAEAEGVAVFGSVALLDVLVRLGRTTAEVKERSRAELLRNWVVDLLPDEGEVLALGRESQWRAGAGALQLSRAAFWRDPTAALDIFRGVSLAVHNEAPEWEIAWLAAALRGVARAAQSEDGWLTVASMIVSHSLWLNGWPPSMLRNVVEQARLVSVDRGRTDPMLSIAIFVRDLLVGALGGTLASQEMVRLVGDLDEQDRLKILKVMVRP